MKPLAIILVILVLAALVGVGYLYFTANLTVTFASVTATDPLTQTDEDYLFYTWTVHLENRSFLPADTVEIQVTPMNGDLLLYGDPAEHTLSARSSGNLSATVLTARSMHSVREAIITWYVWGLPFSTRVTLGK